LEPDFGVRCNRVIYLFRYLHWAGPPTCWLLFQDCSRTTDSVWIILWSSENAKYESIFVVFICTTQAKSYSRMANTSKKKIEIQLA